jgi:hypothetical protein
MDTFHRLTYQVQYAYIKGLRERVFLVFKSVPNSFVRNTKKPLHKFQAKDLYWITIIVHFNHT